MRAVFVFLLVLLQTGFAAAQGNFTARPGDQLRIEVLEDPDLNRTVLVLPDGRFSFPFVGSVRAAGRTVNQIERAVTSGIASNFANEPTVFVSVAALRPEDELELLDEPTIDVYFLGEVGTPGLREVTPGTTFLQGLSQSGGLTEFAAERRVQLRRTDPVTGSQTVYEINYRALQAGARLSQNIVLVPGDVILVPERRLFE